MIVYDEPYPTVGELIKNKDYDYVSYRVMIPELGDKDGIFAGCFSVKNGEIIPLDHDTYYKSEEVISSEEWNDSEEGIKNGLTIIVEGKMISG